MFNIIDKSKLQFIDFLDALPGLSFSDMWFRTRSLDAPSVQSGYEIRIVQIAEI